MLTDVFQFVTGARVLRVFLQQFLVYRLGFLPAAAFNQGKTKTALCRRVQVLPCCRVFYPLAVFCRLLEVRRCCLPVFFALVVVAALV